MRQILDDAQPFNQAGITWGDYVHALVESHGTWANLVDHLYDRGRGVVELPDDPTTVEKGIRRLAKKRNEEGGQYGRWLTRFFSVPHSVESFSRWCGQYHSRFSDLPVAVREEQIRMLDRPPVSESKAAIWTHLAAASIAHQQMDHEKVARRMAMAARIDSVSVPAILERELFRAKLASDKGESDEVKRCFEAFEKTLHEADLEDEEFETYRARFIDQRTYQLLHPVSGEPKFSAAAAMYRSIKTDVSPFVDFKRAFGLAYVLWKTDQIAEAVESCDAAISAAGDGGFLRLRVMALNLMSHIRDEADSPYRGRAATIAQRLEDEELLTRVLQTRKKTTRR